MYMIHNTYGSKGKHFISHGYCRVYDYKQSLDALVMEMKHRLVENIKIPDSAEPRLESVHPPFDLPHQGVVDTYNPFPNLCNS